jgi:multidrug efflux system membrane fusion protein
MDDRTQGTGLHGADRSSFRDGAPALPGQESGRTALPSKRRTGLKSLAGLALLALLGFGLYRVTAGLQQHNDSAVSEPAPPQPVAVALIGKGDVKVTVNAIGTVTPIATVTVKTQVNGQLLEVGFKEGQTVKKGDFLAQIDPRPFEAAKAQFEGQLAHDQGLLDQARNNLARYQTLAKQDSIARQQVEDQFYLVKQTEGSVKVDQAQIDAQKLNLIYARIVSPVDGRIGLRLVDPGNYVQTTDPGIAVITQMHPISVIFTVPEDNLPEIMDALRAGRELEVTAYDRANQMALATGKVSALDSEIDQTTGTVKLRAEFDNLDDKLFPNQFVNVRLLIKTLHDVARVPSRAVQHGAPGAYVYALEGGNKVSAHPVILGPQDGGMVAVSSGLSPGDRVVVDGTDRLRDGAKVTVAAEEKPAETQSAPPQENGASQPASAAPQAPPQGVAPSAGKPAKHLLKQK